MDGVRDASVRSVACTTTSAARYILTYVAKVMETLVPALQKKVG